MPPSDFRSFKNVWTNTAIHSEMEIFLSNTTDWSVTDIEFNGNLTGAQVLAALSFLGTNEFLNMHDISVRVCIFRPTTASLAFSLSASLINTLTNFLHRTDLPVILWVRGHYHLCSVALFTQSLNPHFIVWQHFTHIGAILKVIFKDKLSKLTTKLFSL